MSLDQGIQYESGFGFHQQYFPQNHHYGSQLNGAYLDNNFSLRKLINNIGTNNDNLHGNQGFSSSDSFVSDVFSNSFGPGPAPTLQSLVDTFGGFENETTPALGGPQYNSWPEPSESEVKTPIKFPSQLLSQSSGARASPFSDGPATQTSSLFSSSSNISRMTDFTSASQFSSFSSSMLSSQNSNSGRHENCLGLSDISDRLEMLSTAPPMISSQGSISPPNRDSRDSTPLSWNPMKNISSMTSSLTPSPVMSGQFPKSAPLTKPFPQKEEESHHSDTEEEKKFVLRSPQSVRPEPAAVMSPKLAQTESALTYRAYNKVKLTKPVASAGPNLPSPAPAPGASWSQIVRTSSSKLPSLSPESPPTRRVTRASLTPSPTMKEPAPQLVVEDVPPTTNTVDFYRGPKVDPRWPVSQQVFLGPIPMSITWDEIRNVFYTKVQRRELLHFYVQSKPVNEVVYGQVVFDKVSLANKIVKEGPVKVRGHLINITLMKEKVKLDRKK